MLCVVKEDDMFVDGMWNSPLSQLAKFEWKMGATSLVDNMKRFIQQCRYFSNLLDP